jgi:hypothetical protein
MPQVVAYGRELRAVRECARRMCVPHPVWTRPAQLASKGRMIGGDQVS